MSDRPLETELTLVSARPARLDPGATDWRFLLPTAHLGRVGVDATSDRLHRAALAAWATVIRPIDGGEQMSHDTIVLSEPSIRQVRAAVESLATPGTIRVGPLSHRRRRKLADELRSLGFEVGTWWERPTAASPWCLVSLADRRAAATALRTVAGRGRRAPVEAMLARTGLAGRWSRHVTLLAHRPDPAKHENHHAVAAPGPGCEVTALVTPRFGGSRSIVGVSVRDDGRMLDQVVKLTRSSRDDATTAAEHHALDAFSTASLQPTGAPGRPRLVRHGDRKVLVEQAAAGTPLDRRAVRRDPATALRLGLTWLEWVPVGPPSSMTVDGRLEALVLDPLDAIASLVTTRPERRADHLRRAAELLEPLRAAEVPVVFEHGDLSHPNLFVTAGRSLVAIDWERAHPEGLPLQDLIFYLGYLAESLDRPRNFDDLLESARRTFHTGGWARPDIDLHAERMGIDQRLVPLLELVCWTRAMARLAEPGRPDRPTEDHRHEAFWIASIERAEARTR